MEKSSIEILLIEDDLVAAGIIKELLTESLKPEFSVQHVRHLADGLRLLVSRDFDVILTDLGLPDSWGLETALAVRKQARSTPIMVMTGHDDEEAALKALQLDIQDYLIKDEITGNFLKRAIRYAIQRKRDKEALRQSEQRFTSFMLNLPAAAWVKDPMGRYVYGNAEHERVFSKPFSEYSGKGDEEFLPPETAGQLRKNDEKVLAEGGSLQTVEVLHKPDGTARHFVVSKFPIPGPDGRAAYVAGIALDITERVKAEEEIERLNAQLAARARQSEERFAAFMTNLPAAAWMKDLAGRYVYANAQAERNFGRLFAEFSGKTDGEFLPPETAGNLRENDARVLAEGKALQTTEVVRLPSGIELYHIVSKFPVPGADGRTAYVGGMAFDITELMRTEKALHFSEECFRALVTATSQVLYRMSPDWSEMRQLSSTEFVTDTVTPSSDWLQKYIPPDDQPQVTAVIQEAIRTKSIFELEHRVLRADGSLGWTLSRAIPLLDANGEIIEWFGAANDVTERVEAERAELAARAAALEEANRVLADDLEAMKMLQKLGLLFLGEENLEQILSQVLDAAITISRADFGNIQIRNPETLCLQIAVQHGFPQWWLDFWNNVVEGKGVCGTALGRGERVIVENIEQSPIFSGTEALEIQLKAGVRAVQSTPLVSRSGISIGMFSTHYKAPHRPTDRELRLLDLLARHAADFIEQAQLRKMLRARAAELEEANQDLEAFNYTVAHDLRKPLTVVNGYCQALSELCGDKLDEACKGYLREAYDGTLRMNRLIDALLKFSHLARVELHRESVSLSAVAHEVAMELRLSEPERRVTFKIAEEAEVNSDANLLRVVLDNLLGNAWKYTGMREQAVIELGVTQIDGRPACFVRDNGVGFAMADTEKLFAPFQRLPGANEFKGFGIGLATVARIIERHGGRIWAEGEPGIGATFWFTLQS